MKKLFVFLLWMAMVTGACVGMPQDVHASLLDLTTQKDGFINNAYFVGASAGVVGTGTFDSFVRIQARGTERGYNTDGALEFDTKPGVFTHSLNLSSVPTITINSVVYRQFALDLHENLGFGSLISLDELKIHLEGAGNLTGYPGSFNNPIYDMGANYIKLDAGFTQGSGQGRDMLAHIPNSLFTGPNQWVYLYSKFGVTFASDATFEEWAVRKGGPAPIDGTPEPATMALLGAGLFGFGIIRRRKA